MTRARDARLAGATVLRAMAGLGRSAHMRRRHVPENKQSILIAIVDLESRLQAFVAALHDFPGLVLATLETVDMLYSSASPSTIGAD